ncbi:hypothetical protein GSI_11941 [Ganoderma sinense ZZ0214-1]|uniref:Integrase zinc-binding domain-containing protein n=1 Tax=Ganoderma sinense ZZ0214-1 TaxID=1077348 RepID=A0A2G8RXE4_9APHY|nr:hypothetical protein GSI_11941 [Ganoderma sinense ZZ0214-1]
MPARISGSRSRSRSATSIPEDATGPNKGKSKATRGRKPYPASRPQRDTARTNKKSTRSTSSNPEPDEPSNPDQGTLITGTRLPVPPPMSRGSSSSSSASTKPERSYPDLGMPSREEFADLEEQYIASLDPRKQTKALISQAMFDSIWLALHNPRDNTIGSPQFRWWVRKMFVLARPDESGVLVPFIAEPDSDEGTFLEYGRRGMEDGRIHNAMVMAGARYLNAAAPLPLSVVLHDGKRVAIREQIYDILCVCHERVGHGGRDKTATEIRKTYTWVPKDLIALFVKHCPTCMSKRTKQAERAVDNGPSPEAIPSGSGSGSGSPTSEEEPQATPVAQYVPLPMRNLMNGSQPCFGRVSPLGLPAWSHSPLSAPLPPPSAMLLETGNGLSGSPPWYFAPGAAMPPGSSYFLLPNGMYAATAPLLPRPPSGLGSVQLPSIRVTDTDTDTDTDGPGAGALPHHLPHLPDHQYYPGPDAHANSNLKVTLPSLSQVLSGGLTAARTRQPLQALSRNAVFDPLQVNVNTHLSPRRRGGHEMHTSTLPSSQDVPYVPVIDPALLAQDGVHMLAMAAEVMQRAR